MSKRASSKTAGRERTPAQRSLPNAKPRIQQKHLAELRANHRIEKQIVSFSTKLRRAIQKSDQSVLELWRFLDSRAIVKAEKDAEKRLWDASEKLTDAASGAEVDVERV